MGPGDITTILLRLDKQDKEQAEHRRGIVNPRPSQM